MKTDLEISSETKLYPIIEIAKKLGIEDSFLEPYGKYVAKLDLSLIQPQKGKLILVTSTNPTPSGEGKTTMSIGLSDALCDLGKNSMVALREPSLGPVFGVKGGATGGGYAQVAPMENINLHFTGDIHAVTSCNNLLCAAIDNHIYQGNALNIDSNHILFSRCMDMNDRSLRSIQINSGNELERKDSFQISVASEIMAILCLSENLEELKENCGNILIAYSLDKKPIYAKDLHIEGALTILLKDAFKPNLVQTLEHHPALIHGGPFANIAHGCNSIVATKMALSLADYVVTEAGFGSDLGAEKFLDLKCQRFHLKPDAIVVNTTIRSLKYNGGVKKEDLQKENLEALKKGSQILKVHVENMKKYSNHVVICVNHFESDTKEELNYINTFASILGVPMELSDAHTKGGLGSKKLAQTLLSLLESPSTFTPIYALEDSISEKIEKVSKEIYRAEKVEYTDNAKETLEELNHLGYQNYPICIAKTQYSLSDDAKKIGKVGGYTVTVRDLKVCSGAKFIVVYMGDILTMPGLSKHPAYEKMDFKNNEIEGLF